MFKETMPLGSGEHVRWVPRPVCTKHGVDKNGQPTVNRRAPAPSNVSESPMAKKKSRDDIEKMLEYIESTDSINENKRMGAIAALQWVLGDEEALGTIMDLPPQEETGT
jgi:hypothetical protein